MYTYLYIEEKLLIILLLMGVLMLVKKSIVIYKSNSGFTKKYAKWIQEDLDCDVVDYSHVSKLKLDNYDVIIYGSRIHAGKLDGIKKMIKILEHNHHSKFIVFATGGTPNADTEIIKTIWENSLSEEDLLSIPHFYMQSGLNYELMSSGDRLLMKELNTVFVKMKDQNKEEQGYKDVIKDFYDISSKEYIQPLLSYVKDLLIQS